MIIFDYIKQYHQIIIPLLITLIFATFVYFLAIHLQKKYEIFKLRYKACENTNLHLGDLQKLLRIIRAIVINYPYLEILNNSGYKTFKLIWNYYEKTLDSIRNLNTSIITLKGLFISKEVKKHIAKTEEKLEELANLFKDFQIVEADNLEEAKRNIENIVNMMKQKGKKQEKIFTGIESKFLNLQKEIFKEMKIIK